MGHGYFRNTWFLLLNDSWSWQLKKKYLSTWLKSLLQSISRLKVVKLRVEEKTATIFKDPTYDNNNNPTAELTNESLDLNNLLCPCLSPWMTWRELSHCVEEKVINAVNSGPSLAAVWVLHATPALFDPASLQGSAKVWRSGPRLQRRYSGIPKIEQSYCMRVKVGGRGERTICSSFWPWNEMI